MSDREGNRMVSHCPKCGYEQFCPCENCIGEALKQDKKPWIWIDEELIKCANCGYTAHIDQWGDWEMEEYRKTTHPQSGKE